MSALDDISAAKIRVKNWLGDRSPELAIILGSGLGAVAEQLHNADRLDYADIPGFVASGVSGHAGCLHCGELLGRSVLLFQGRYHCYEGYSAWQVTAPVRLAAELGCEKLLLTNAAGGIAEGMQPGDFMLVKDHINLTGQNPLIGRPEREFVDLSHLYAQEFYPVLNRKLQQQGITLHTGVIAWMLGPNYETPAEIRLLENFGAAAVSMSTIPEAIVAKRYGLEVAAISYISNLAAGKGEMLDHEDVLASGSSAAEQLEMLLAALFETWCD